MANLMIVFPSDTEILKVFQQQVSRKNEKNIKKLFFKNLLSKKRGEYP